MKKNILKTHIEPELLRVQEVMKLTGIGSAYQIQRLRKECKFPNPVRIGKLAIAWRRSDLMEWIKNLPTVSDKGRK